MNKAQRKYACEKSLLFFSANVLPHHLTLEPAEFHKDFVNTLQNPDDDKMVIIGFRGSAKTTFSSLATPLWAALNNKYNFIVVIAATAKKAKSIIGNIKYELENNKYIKNLYPNAIGNRDEWTKTELVLDNGVKIIGRSKGQSVRGEKHRQYRPEFVIVDDPEDLDDVKTKAKRDDTEKWFNGEVIPAINENKSKLLVIGNLLHRDSLISRLKERDSFKTLEFPLIEKDKGRGLSEIDRCTWKAKYPTQEAIDAKRRNVGNVAFHREYLLDIISEEEQIVRKSDIVRYSNKRLTTRNDKFRISPRSGALAVDLAISKKETSDYTAMVGGILAKDNGEDVIYILPNPINKRLDLNETIEAATAYYDTLPRGSKMFVENVAYQKAAIDQMKNSVNLPVQGIRPIKDKTARLETASVYIKQGKIRFPKQGCDELIDQLTGFGVEEHDDMVDALVYLILGLMNAKKSSVVGIGRGDAI